MRITHVPIACLVMMLSSCATEGTAEPLEFVDSAGRSCTVDPDDISATATCVDRAWIGDMHHFPRKAISQDF